MNIQDPNLPPRLVSSPEPARVVPAVQERCAALEAMLFASPGPVKMHELLEATGWPARQLEADIEALSQQLRSRGLELQQVAGALRLVTSSTTSAYVEKLLGVQTRRRLTRAQLETLAVVAYRQPVTRAEAEALRGVSCERTLGQLVDLRLIREVGRAELPGRPFIYGTTSEFLRYFGLNSLEQLPDMRELKRRMPAPQVSASQASWNAAARGEADRPEGFESVDVAPPAVAAPEPAEEPKKLGTMQPLAAELAAGPSQGLMKLFDKIRNKKPARVKADAVPENC